MRIDARFASALPDAKTAVIYRNDDAGNAKLFGLKADLEPRASQIVSELNYSVDDPTIDSPIVEMKASGVDAVSLMTIPKMASQATHGYIGRHVGRRNCGFWRRSKRGENIARRGLRFRSRGQYDLIAQ